MIGDRKKCLTLSDIHYGNVGSSSKHLMHNAIYPAVQKSELVVFNGDWLGIIPKKRRDLENIVSENLVELEKWLDENPKTLFGFVLGNHDRVELFLEGLKELERKHPNLIVSSKYLRMGDALFLHGDQHSRVKLNTFDDISPGSQVLSSEARKRYVKNFKAIPPTEIAEYQRRIIHNLQEEDPQLLVGVKHIFSGDTHKPYTNNEFEGFMMHNTGGAVERKNKRFNMLNFELSDEGNVAEVTPIPLLGRIAPGQSRQSNNRSSS
jgi:hypothetical protein